MKLTELIDKLNEKFPENICESWDNVGLLLGNKDKDVKKVLIALEVNSKAIDKAIQERVDVIISHHPLIFKSLKKITKDDMIGSRIMRLLKNDIAVYAMHTNLDSATGGLNDYVFKLLDLDAKRMYEDETKNRPLRYFNLTKKMTIEEMVEVVKEKLNISQLRVIYDEYYTKKDIRSFALVTGSGMDFFNEVKDKVDLFITADVKYHEAQDALEQGVSIIDFGHLESEVHAVDLLSNYLKETTNLQIVEFHNNPVYIY